VGFVVGEVDASRQLFDFAEPNLDQALAAELGAAIAAATDDIVLHGSGTGMTPRGLQNVSGITALSKTNASPTPATNLAAIGDLVNQTSAAYGAQVDTIVLHPRRFNFLISKLGYAPQWPTSNVVVSAAIATNVGGSQDEIYAFASSEVWLFRRPPAIAIYPEVKSATLEVRVQVRQAIGLLAGRQPAAIGRLTGSELVAPTF
jgi:Phage capsid family